MNLMEKFLKDRRHLIKTWGIEYITSNNFPHLIIKDPCLLAGYTGYLKFQCQKKDRKSKVFYRGQIKNYDLIPSLFRDNGDNIPDNAKIELRHKAFNRLVAEIPTLYNMDRFKNENLDAILQHYGIKTPWIDLVDNLFIAIWFATNRIVVDKNRTAKLEPSTEKHGWIYYFQVTNDIEYYDLREHHSSLSLRLHSQHGISATRKDRNWNTKTRNMNSYLVSTVKFPITKEWILADQIFNIEYLFPNEIFDNTYKYLKMDKFSKLLQQIIVGYDLGEDEIGHITIYD